MLALLLSFAIAGACPEPVGLADLRAELGDGEATALSRDRDGFRAAWRALRGHLACLDRPLTREDAARFHALSALAAELDDDVTGAIEGFRAARAALPSGKRPAWIGAGGTVIDARYRAALLSPSDPRSAAAVAVPDGTLLVIDGLETRARPTDRAAIYQALSLDGTVQWTSLLPAGAALPPPLGAGALPELAEARDASAPLEVPADPAELLASATEALADGDFELALRLSLPAISDHPRFARSFRAVADLAADQAARGSRPAATAPPAGAWGGGPYRYPARPPKPPSEFLLGFDAGLPTGVRVEWKLHARAVDGIGLRLGANLLIYDGLHPIPDQTFYMDFNLPSDWQLELGLGLMTYTGWAYGQLGLGLQYDPDGPFQAQIGARIAGYGVTPEASLSFLW